MSRDGLVGGLGHPMDRLTGPKRPHARRKSGRQADLEGVETDPHPPR